MKVAELREICELTLALTEAKLNNTPHLHISNFAGEVFARLLSELDDFKYFRSTAPMSDRIKHERAKTIEACLAAVEEWWASDTRDRLTVRELKDMIKGVGDESK